MNMPSSTMVGTSSTRASQRSSSSSRWRRGGGASPKVESIAWTAIANLSLLSPPGGHGGANWDDITSGVDLLEFLLGPLDRLLCGHALHRLGVHVGDEVLVPNLGSPCIGRPGEARCLTQPCRNLIGPHHRVIVPQFVLFPVGGARRGKAFLRQEPLLVVGRGLQPLHQSPRRLLVLRILHEHVRL